MTEYSPAPAAAEIGKKLIGSIHTRLEDVRVEFVFRDTAAKSQGRTVLGRAKKITGLTAFLARPITSQVEFDTADDFFLVEIAEDEWDRMGVKGRTALVDHELTHCVAEFDQVKEEWKLSLRGHDIEEFSEVVERNGLYKNDLREFGDAIKTQLALFEDAA